MNFKFINMFLLGHSEVLTIVAEVLLHGAKLFYLIPAEKLMTGKKRPSRLKFSNMP